jgi:D-threonate/D-erythronate kinase
MPIKVAIVADDLTGALDTGTPFADAGLSVAVAVDVTAVEAAIATGAEIVVVNTASRALDPIAAAERVRQAAIALKRALPEFVLKKIDSRLKGNVAAESQALAASFGRPHLLVAPAVPDQQRHTYQGKVVGFGVAKPLPIAPLFSGGDMEVRIADAASDVELDEIVARQDWSKAVAVGARGLGRALARRLAGRPASAPFKSSPRTLFAFGSRDPITTTQMEVLLQSGLIASHSEAPAGTVPNAGVPARLPMLVRCSGELVDTAGAVADRFAEGVSQVVQATKPDVLMIGGGDTACAILSSMGARVLLPKGEIDAGIPWFEVERPGGGRMRCVVKSGGFGNPQSLLKILRGEPDMRQVGQ